MKHNEYGNAADIVGMVSSVLGTLEKKIAEQQKKVEAYEKAWKKKNPLWRNFCKVNKGEQPIEVAEDFACHVIAQALEIVADQARRDHVCVFVEDARQRKWYNDAGKSRDKLQGAGSIKRDCKIWEDFLRDKGIPFKLIAPKNNTTKLSAPAFKSITGYTGRTCEHSRDAAMMVYGR